MFPGFFTIKKLTFLRKNGPETREPFRKRPGKPGNLEREERSDEREVAPAAFGAVLAASGGHHRVA